MKSKDRKIPIEKSDSMPVLVSVAMIAYNVDRYISEAIESVLMQKTKFPFELIIGEDFSTDNTLQIVLEYQKKYPKIIRVLVREKNLGLTPNSVDTQNHCLGKYIALLDGDDYWTDEHKLQKQIDVLENHSEYSGCAHQSLIIKGSREFPVRLFGMEEDADFAGGRGAAVRPGPEAPRADARRDAHRGSGAGRAAGDGHGPGAAAAFRRAGARPRGGARCGCR